LRFTYEAVEEFNEEGEFDYFLQHVWSLPGLVLVCYLDDRCLFRMRFIAGLMENGLQNILLQ
jgi:hypothetical protein